MSDTGLTPAGGADVPEVVRQALARTPARLLVGRAGPGYRTGTWLKLREDHAAARDAVHAELNLQAAFGQERIDRFRLAWVQTQVRSKAEYLLRPDLGRRLDDESRQRLRADYPTGADLQIVIGDGLSATAVAAQCWRCSTDWSKKPRPAGGGLAGQWSCGTAGSGC